MTCEDCRPCGRGCLCICHSPELLPTRQAPKHPQRYTNAFLGFLALVLLQSSIHSGVSTFLNGSYGHSTLWFLYAAFLWKWGMPHVERLLRWMVER